MLRITIEGGNIFDGTAEQFQDCFFTFAFKDTGGRILEILDFCRRNGFNHVVFDVNQ